MKTFIFLLKTEIVQGKVNFFLTALISIFLGMALNLGFKAKEKIESLASKITWNADLAILPKGVNLEDFKNEITGGHTFSFLPRALYETTVGLAQQKFQLSAVLPIAGSVMQTGDDIGLGWYKKTASTETWAEQNVYSTPEWGYKVIAGFFASGSESAMMNLKELIDKKTVAQAVWIKKQQQADNKIQEELSLSLTVFAVVLILMATASFGSIFIWLKTRLKNTINVLFELGISNSQVTALMSSLVLLFIMAPVLLGYFLLFQMSL